MRDVDESFASLLGATPGELIGQRLADVAITPDDRDQIAAVLWSAVLDSAGQTRVAVAGPGGDRVHVHLVVTRSPASDGSLTVVALDESIRVEREESLARSQRRWLALVRNAADILFTTDSDGALTSVTSALPERLGWAVEEVVGLTGLDFVQPDDRNRAMHAWAEVSSGKASQRSLDVRLLHADSSLTWARVVITDLRGDPDVQAVVGNVTDITEQKREHSRRRDIEERFRARFDQSRLPQTLQTADGTYEAVNDAFCALVGRDRDELIGTLPEDITHPDDPGTSSSVLQGMLLGEVTSAQVERILADRDGSPVPVRIDATLLRDADGSPSGFAASVQDQRPLRDSELAREQLQRFFDVVAGRTSDFVTIHDRSGNSVYASPAGLAMFGEKYDQPTSTQGALVHPDDLPDVLDAWQKVMANGGSFTWRYRAMSAENQWIWIEHTATNLLDTDVGGIISNIRDVTPEVETEAALRASETRYRAIAETAAEGILVISPDGYAAYANARLAEILGLPLGQVYEVPIWAVLEGPTAEMVARRVRERTRRGPEYYEVPYRHPDGTSRLLRVNASPMPLDRGRSQGSLAMISDITESRRQERELRHAAQHDHLTGLTNRTTLMQHLQRLGVATVDDVAVLFVDLDHFKDVNDGRGHTAGDHLLIEVANRLQAACGPDDVVARFGGDEFIVVLHRTDTETAMATADRLIGLLSETYNIGHHTIRNGATIGVAMSPAASAEDLLRYADTAMYAAKASGRGRVRLFDAAMSEQAEERYVLGAELLSAIANDELDMAYQPVVDIDTGEVAGVEALARWNHPVRGTIAPTRFVALAEMSASARDLDRWVIRRTMRDIGELKADWTMPEAAYVAINLSGQSLSDDSLDAFIIACADEAGLDPAVITLEITESAIMADKDVAIDVLQRLRDRGFDIAIDDFGTGYSSMAYLRDLPITVLKIDRGFVQGIPEDQHSLAIVTSLIELARSLELKVVAEGVETAAHLRTLRARGCTLAQGWLWSAAMTPAELRESGIMEHRFGPDGAVVTTGRD
jgi:diguanylate cyclase (GGDEF)-like protein/PAS domain S-box-containing protein